MSTLNVAIVQAELHWHDAEANRAQFSSSIEQVAPGADLIVLPEMFTTGFSMDAPGQAEDMSGPTLDWMRRQARAANSAICGSLIIRDNGQYFNRFVLMHADGRVETYDKRHLFRLAGEDAHYSAGTANAAFQVNGWRIRPQVCYDLRFPVWSRRTQDADFDLLVYVANWPSPRHHAWETLLRARAIENQCYVIGVNRCGIDDNELRYSGGSAVIDYFGHDLVNLKDVAGTGEAALDADAMQHFRKRFPFDRDADRFALVD
jgi:omega-amidase